VSSLDPLHQKVNVLAEVIVADAAAEILVRIKPILGP
jgi:hypothetical protein